MSKIERQVISDEDFEEILDVIYEKLLKQGWNRKPAKMTLEEHKIYPEQSLLSHSINAISVIHRILRFIDQRGYRKISMELYTKALIVSLLHDIGKMKRIKGHIQETDVADIKKVLKEIFKALTIRVNFEDDIIKSLLLRLEELVNKNLDEIYVTIKEHQGIDGSALLASHEGIVSKDFYDLYNLVLLGDVLAYYRNEDDITKLKKIVDRILYRLTGREGFKLSYYRVTKLHGIITQFLHKYIEEYITSNNSNAIPLLYSTDRTFFLIEGKVNIELDALLDFVIKKIEEYLRSEFSRRVLKDTLLIDNDKKYGLVIDPFLLLLKDIEEIMDNVAKFYHELNSRVTEQTKKNNIKKVEAIYKKYNLSFERDYSVDLTSRMLKFYYRFAKDADIIGNLDEKGKNKMLTKYLLEFLNKSSMEIIENIESKDLEKVVAGIIFESEIEGRKVKEYSNPFEIVGKLLAKAITKINEENLNLKKESLFEKYFKKQICISFSEFKDELKSRIKGILIFDPPLVKDIDALIQSPEYYVLSKAEGSPSRAAKKKYMCILCNLSGFGFSLRTQRSALPTRIFTNRNVANAPLNVRWICALCLLESIFRAIVLNQRISPDDKKIYIFMMPDVIYTRLFAIIIYRFVDRKFGSNFQTFNLADFSDNIISRVDLEVGRVFSETRNRGLFPLNTPDAHYIMFMELFPKIDGRSIPDSYAWYEALCVTVTLQRLFCGKYIITESFVPPTFSGVHTIFLDSPNSYIRRLLEITTSKGIFDSNEISLTELDNLEELLAAIYVVGDTRDINRKLRPSQEAPRTLKTFLDFHLPGSKFFAETLAYAKAKNRDYQVKKNNKFLKACKILDKAKGGNLIEW